jgi:glycosyltransferase involved in cell wall biosynthesis
MRVIMFGTGNTFCRDWARTAGRVAEVIDVACDTDEPGTALPFRPVPAPMARTLRRGADPLYAARTVRLIRRIEADSGPVDVVHAHFYALAHKIARATRVTGHPLVITEHSTALTKLSPDKQVTARGLKLADRSYRQAAMVMPVSESLLAAIRDLGLPGRFTVLPNPVDTALFKQRPGPRRPIPHLVTTARLAKVKRIDLLLNAYSRLQSSGREFLATIIGDGPERGRLTQLASSLDLGMVDFIGQQSPERVADTLRDADALVMSSAIENMPLAIEEALCCGVPVVASAVGGIPEVIDSSNGVLVAPGDVDALAAAIEYVVFSAEWDHARIATDAAARFSIDSLASQLGEVYETVARQAP